jgi:hypothetical protein
MSCPFLPKCQFTFVSVEKWALLGQKKAKVMPNFSVDSSLIIVLIKLLHILYEVPTCRAETKTLGLALLSP